MSETQEKTEIKDWGQFLAEGSKVVLGKAKDAYQKTIKEHPEFVAGAVLIAESMVLPTMAALVIPEVINMFKAGVPANPPGNVEALKEIVGGIGWMLSDMFVFNGGLKRTTGMDIFADKSK